MSTKLERIKLVDRISDYDTEAKPGFEQNDLNKIHPTETKFLRSVEGCTVLDKIQNENFRRE